MKKSLLALSLCTTMLTANAQADTLLGVYAGVQGWNMDTEGGFSDSTSLTEFTFDSETKTNFYVALEHPIPLIPNFKVRRTEMDNAGSTVLSESFSFGGELFAANTTVLTDVELTSTDYVLYYELFDNDLISFDIGINGKHVDGALFVQEQSDASMNARESFSGIVPMLYSRVAFGFPGTDIGIYGEGSFLSIDDHTLSDYEIALTYSFVENLAVDMTLQVGYRSMALELDDLDGVYTDLTYDGVFAGLEVHF